MALETRHANTKKPSINSLLNPQDAGNFPAHIPHHDAPSHGSPPYPGSFHSRTMAWTEETTHTLPSSHAHRPYQSLAHAPPHLQSYADLQSSSGMRSRPDHERVYTSVPDRSSWPNQSHLSPPSASYAQQSSAPVYPPERMQVPPEYPPQVTGPYNHNQSYNEIPPAQLIPSTWQHNDRPSQSTTSRQLHPAPETHGSRYNGPPSFDNTNQFPAPNYSQPQQVVVPPSTPALDEIARRNGNGSTPKRSLPDGDESGPKAKRAKSKPKSTGQPTAPATSAPGTSKRGYNAKKRIETALIAAQNDAIRSEISKGKDKVSSDSNAQEPWQEKPSLQDRGDSALIPELQSARCMSNRYRNETFPRCVSCTRRWAGDTCRFQGIRFFVRDASKAIQCLSFGEHHQRFEQPTLEFPKSWNRPVIQPHIQRTKVSIAKALLPALKEEAEHIKVQEIVRRPRETEVRATCDTCMTSLFSNSWMCRLCGREVCSDCFNQVRELTYSPPDATPQQSMALAQRRERYNNLNPFFLSCTRRSEHRFQDLTPVTRFASGELATAIEQMTELLRGVDMPEGSSSTHDAGSTLPHEHHDPSFSQYSRSSPSRSSLAQPAVYDTYIPSNTPPHVAEIPIDRLQIIQADAFDEPGASLSSFAPLWSHGVPLLVKGLSSRFKLDWTPRYLSEQHGDQGCIVIDCQTDANKRISIKEFFNDFGNYANRGDACWKLKDWPPTADFKTAFPELFEDFSQAVPVPDYVRRDGVYNIGSHFPTNAIGPDLGPKMYNSMASSQEKGSKGSTRLHMDMADALNVMLHAEKCPDGTEGYAVWDIYRAEDSDHLRAFLKKKFGPGSEYQQQQMQQAADKTKAIQQSTTFLKAHDPIHIQQFYLDVSLRKALYDETGVKSFRIYQRPGDGIFIPAGCAHQVANMSDAMKIAIDFVSPENITRCQKLTQEFREQNQSKVWKDDVLQLKSMMWYAWVNCGLKEAELEGRSGSHQRTGSLGAGGGRVSGTSGSLSSSASEPAARGPNGRGSTVLQSFSS